jgi:DNA-binding MarR family transcriptional regulator
MARRADDHDATVAAAASARRAWQLMSALVLSHDRKAAAAEALGLSFARVRALRRLADEPLTLRGLAAELLADPPYVTLIVDDLEERGLVERRPHPDDRRAKLVALTRAGRAAARRAGQILDDPPPALGELDGKDLDALVRVLERVVERG